MENTLKALFDFQKFAGNRELQEKIDAAHRRTGRRISLDEADLVAAAGLPYSESRASDKDDKDPNSLL